MFDDIRFFVCARCTFRKKRQKWSCILAQLRTSKNHFAFSEQGIEGRNAELTQDWERLLSRVAGQLRKPKTCQSAVCIVAFSLSSWEFANKRSTFGPGRLVEMFD